MGAIDDGLAPDLTLESTEGPRRLRPAFGHRLLLAFYQEDNTPACNAQINSFKSDFPLFEELGTEVVAISTDNLDSHQRFLEHTGGLPFPLVSDTDGIAAKAFGVFDSENHRAFRAVFVIDSGGHVSYRSHRYNPQNFEEYERVFQALGLKT